MLGAGARPVDEKATATRERTRSIGSGCAIGDYVLDRGSAWGRLRPPPVAEKGSNKEWQGLADWRVASNEDRGIVTTGRALRRDVPERNFIKSKNRTIRYYIEVWLSLVERYVRDVEVASSNLVTSTKK